MAYSKPAVSPLHTVVETLEFRSNVSRVLSDVERVALIDFVAGNPMAGEVMPGTGGARKLRWAAKGKGKSGGARVITFYSGPTVPVFLMTIFGKGEKAKLSKAERNELRDILAYIVAEYRKGVKRHV